MRTRARGSDVGEASAVKGTGFQTLGSDFSLRPINTFFVPWLAADLSRRNRLNCSSTGADKSFNSCQSIPPVLRDKTVT